MKKSTFMAMILGTIGGILFALGMCMALIPEWNAFRPGVIMGVIGAVVLLIMVLVWRRMENKEPIKLSGKTIGATLIGIVGALLLGVGMCLTMVWSHMVAGIVIGIVGIVVLLCLIPFIKGLSKKIYRDLRCGRRKFCRIFLCTGSICLHFIHNSQTKRKQILLIINIKICTRRGGN